MVVVFVAACLAVGVWVWSRSQRVAGRGASPAAEYAGSVTCRECHEPFYRLWADSHHGLAMQPFTPEFARGALTPQTKEIAIGARRYLAQIQGPKASIREAGPEGEKRYTMEHVLGGKNVFYFLTPLERGRLQTLPLAYDVHRKEWLDMAASGLRHSPGRPADAPLDSRPARWKERPFTFNTACHGCHVSQLSTNYIAEKDAYETTWAEPGINCETCHGPAKEHVRVCREAPKGRRPRTNPLAPPVPTPFQSRLVRGRPEYLKIISYKRLTVAQANETCAPCHAKMAPLTETFAPGGRFFDHFDLVTLEHADFHPDGRDLGENYTYTSWLMSPCAKSGRLKCIHCHTASGRYRFTGEMANNACLPCHAEHVKNAAAHSRHKAEGEGSRCVGCHMPATEFARMRRSDHSMRAPAPAATLAFKSPNACNLCHADKDAAWSDKYVREWRSRDYQAEVLQRAGLIAEARRGEWRRLPEMFRQISRNDRDEVYAASLLRLMESCRDDRKQPVLLQALKDASPLVRASAVRGLGGCADAETLAALAQAAGDDVRLVRVQAAARLAAFPEEARPPQERARAEKATKEFLDSLLSRPDQWSAHYNLGNYHLDRGQAAQAAAEFEKACALEPQSVLPLVNVSIAYARLGKPAKAEQSLRKALAMAPDNAAAHFNMGLLKAEQNDLREAESHLRAALKSNPTLSAAAYNLGVLLAKDRPAEAVAWCRKAHESAPDEPRYAYTYAFYLRRDGDVEGAVRVLKEMVSREMRSAEAYMLLGEIHEKQGRRDEALAVYGRAAANEKLTASERDRAAHSLRRLQALNGTRSGQAR